MKQFYTQVRPDTALTHFYAACALCGRREYASPIPLLCRGGWAEACEHGNADRLRQSAYNRAKTDSVQRLALLFNQCACCHRWVCDDCYRADDGPGICGDCFSRP